MVNIRAEDIKARKGTMAVHLGRSERGESTKSGRDQGVVFEDPYAIEIMARRVKDLGKRDRVFPITTDAIRRWWNKARSELGLPEAPAHALRHTGPSRDLATGYRTFEQVQRRGRWKAMESVQRYARPHMWATVCGQVRQDIRQRGQSILAQRPARPAICYG